MRTEIAGRRYGRTLLEIVRGELLRRAILVISASLVFATLVAVLRSSGIEGTLLACLAWILGT